MDPRFVEYCSSLGLADTLIERVQWLYSHFAAFSQERIDRIFISDVIKEDRTREYLNLVLFSLHYVYDAINFVGAPRVTISPLRFAHLGYAVSDFDFKSPTPDSRLFVQGFFHIGGSYSLELRASGSNCTSLVEVVKQCLMKPLF